MAPEIMLLTTHTVIYLQMIMFSYVFVQDFLFKRCNKKNLLDHSKEVWKNLEFSVDVPIQQNEHSKQHQLLKKYIEEIYTAVEIL